MRRVQRSLVVEDDVGLQMVLRDILQSRSEEVESCSTVRAAVDLLSRFQPELVLLDVQLADGQSVAILERFWDAAEAIPTPVFVAISGNAGPDVTFRLAQLGVRAFAAKPLELNALNTLLDASLTEAPALAPTLRGCVGRRSIHEVEAEVRQTMIKEAVTRSQGSRRGAARLLNISRQLLQHMLRKLDD